MLPLNVPAGIIADDLPAENNKIHMASDFFTSLDFFLEDLFKTLKKDEPGGDNKMTLAAT